jgi:hypothetical protein
LQTFINKITHNDIKKGGIMDTIHDAPAERVFWLNGQSIKNLEELHSKLIEMDIDTYRSFVNSDKNDFATWIKEILKDEELSSMLKSSLKKDEYAAIIEQRIKQLKIVEELEIPEISIHMDHRRLHQIKDLLDEINYKIVHHSDILDKYEIVRDNYQKLTVESKRKIYADVLQTYEKLQNIWNRINY